MEENWINIGYMWADYGRTFFHEDSDTNNLAQRYAELLKLTKISNQLEYIFLLSELGSFDQYLC